MTVNFATHHSTFINAPCHLLIFIVDRLLALISTICLFTPLYSCHLSISIHSPAPPSPRFPIPTPPLYLFYYPFLSASCPFLYIFFLYVMEMYRDDSSLIVVLCLPWLPPHTLLLSFLFFYFLSTSPTLHSTAPTATQSYTHTHTQTQC